MTISINSNVAAMAAQRYLGMSNNRVSKEMGHLASGNRINSARDDAAGLQLSNRLMTESNGLSVAARNASDGISLTQTAEGGMKETTDILQRMRDLSLQSANGVNTDDERTAIQDEVSALNDEINRIANTTQFAGKHLLNGTYGTKAFQVGADGGSSINVHLESVRSDIPQMGGDLVRGELKADKNWTVSARANELHISLGEGDDKESLTIHAKAGDDIQELATYINGQSNKINASVDEHGQLQILKGNFEAPGPMKITGSLADELELKPTRAMTVNDIDVSTMGGAQLAVGLIDSASKYIDSQRADLGALQNRFDHSISNLNKVNEDITASKGRILDTDYAKTTSSMAASQIRSQAGQAILSQAKNLPQSALKLLG